MALIMPVPMDSGEAQRGPFLKAGQHDAEGSLGGTIDIVAGTPTVSGDSTPVSRSKLLAAPPARAVSYRENNRVIIHQASVGHVIPIIKTRSRSSDAQARPSRP